MVLFPSELSNKALEFLSSSSSVSEPSKKLFGALYVFVQDTADEQHYLSKMTDWYFLSQSLFLYILQVNHHDGLIGKNFESVK